jgi:protein-disulfide isomerase
MSKEKAKGNLKGFYILFAVVGLIGIGAVGYSVGSKALSTAAMQPVDLEGVKDNDRLLVELAVPITQGDENAPVTIAVFEDYFCSHCAMFSLRERPRLEAEYVETGKARIKLFDFVLDPRPEAGTFLAARAARCADDQGRFWDYHERLYRSQMSWGAETDKLGVFQQYAEDLGLDADAFGTCINSDRHAREISANIELAHALGLGGTPAVLVGKEGGMSRQVPNYAFETIKEAVDEILGGGGTS